MMTQIFVLGASNAYGVGGEHGGWADLLKQYVHTVQYGENGIGEKHELYNFAKPGADIQFVMQTFSKQVEDYGRNWRKIAVLSIGLNNAKAADVPDNFVTSTEAYEEEMRQLLTQLCQHFEDIYVLGYWPCNETKTMPKISPFTGGKSYFSNERISLFNTKLQALSQEFSAHYVMVGVESEEWISNYLYQDGLHPNHAGHTLICDALKKVIVL